MTSNDPFPYKIVDGEGPGHQSAIVQYFKGGYWFHYVAAKGVKQSAQSPPVKILKGEFAEEGLVYTKQSASSEAQSQKIPNPAELENGEHFEEFGAEGQVKAYMQFTLHRRDSEKSL